MLRSMMLFPAALLAASCGGHDGEFDGLATEFGTGVDAMRALNDEHADAVDHAADLATVRSLEDQHRARMMGEISAMDDIVARMETCEQLCCMDRDGMMGGMRDDLDRHQGAMLASVDLDSARAEERRHQQAAGDELDRMDHDHRHMMTMMGMDMDCGHDE